MKSLRIFAIGVVVGALCGAPFGGVYFQHRATSGDGTQPNVGGECMSQAECPVCPNTFSTDLLPPPSFDEKKTTNPFVTNREGEVRVGWSEVKGAKGYRVFLENSKGKTVMTYKSSRTVLYLKEIPVPEGMKEVKYQVRLASINGLDQDGERGVKKELTVKAMGSLMAPKVREIRIED